MAAGRKAPRARRGGVGRRCGADRRVRQLLGIIHRSPMAAPAGAGVGAGSSAGRRGLLDGGTPWRRRGGRRAARPSGIPPLPIGRRSGRGHRSGGMIGAGPGRGAIRSGVPPVSAEKAQDLPPRSDAGRFLQGLAGPGLRHDRLRSGKDPGGRPPVGPEAPALVRPGADPHGSDYMTITRLELDRFTAFEALGFKPSPGINVLVGPNGTGKTHLMKVAYAACDVSKTDIGFAEEIVRVFMPSGGAIRRLVKRRGEGSRCAVRIRRGDRLLRVSFSNHTIAADSAIVRGARRWRTEPVEGAMVESGVRTSRKPISIPSCSGR